ncbi:MAG TPA: GNAT family N-acetyltransferase [Solirubrobacterales bacterium]|nr:GNAT family N-acetyltransferase [Solirubrobacterales bacterium]
MGPYPPHPRTRYPPLIVNAALTGMVGQRERVPNLPVSEDEIVRDAWLCHQLGATIIHLHARDANGQPEWHPDVYASLIERIRARCPEAVLCVTTSGRTFQELERRAAVLELSGDAKPDMASLTLGSLNFATGPSVNAPIVIEALAERMRAAGIKAELEVFDSGMASEASRLLDRGLLEPPLYANLLLGSHHTAPATLRELSHLVDSLPSGTVWAAAGIGAYQLPANALSIFAGGHVRTGLEDNPYLDWERRLPATNARLVERVVELAERAGRRPAAPLQAREMLGLALVEEPGYRIRRARLPADREGVLRVLETANMHRVPSPEMDGFEVGSWYVAEAEAAIVGVAGFRIVTTPEGAVGKTTLLAVDPARRSSGIGRALQELRLELMRDRGATRVITNADRPETIDWYRRHFGYRIVGEVPKLHEFGLPDVDAWTTLEAEL